MVRYTDAVSARDATGSVVKACVPPHLFLDGVSIIRTPFVFSSRLDRNNMTELRNCHYLIAKCIYFDVSGNASWKFFHSAGGFLFLPELNGE